MTTIYDNTMKNRRSLGMDLVPEYVKGDSGLMFIQHDESDGTFTFTDDVTDSEFASAIGEAVKTDYDLDDGSDLCRNLLMTEVVTTNMSIDMAAQIVAQHIEQA